MIPSMLFQRNRMKYQIPILCALLMCLPHCYRLSTQKPADRASKESLSEKVVFIVENQTPTTLYTTCFYYAKRTTGIRWEWYKTEVITIPPYKNSPINIPLIATGENQTDIQSYLAIFKNSADAESSIFELLSDEQKLDLGSLMSLNKKKIRIIPSHYGFKKERLEYSVEEKPKIADPSGANKPALPELDFSVENQSGEDLYLTSFVYELQGGHPQWDFDKLTPVSDKTHTAIFLKKGESTVLDVATISSIYDWEHVRGYLGIFKKDEQDLAENATFESLKPAQKLDIGILGKLHNQKIVLQPYKYGLLSGFDEEYPDIEFSIKPRYPFQADKTHKTKAQKHR